LGRPAAFGHNFIFNQSPRRASARGAFCTDTPHQ
jgi:hypothetical protein